MDPALNEPKEGMDFTRLEDHRYTPTGVYVFDFDGVVISRSEDDIYRLAPEAEEFSLLEQAAHTFGINCANYDIRYQRHLLFQAAAWKCGLRMQPGPGLSLFRQVGDSGLCYVLTARSGWHAVERMRAFLKAENIQPIETYTVGRVAKDRQIELLDQAYPSRQLIYVEDSASHLQAVKAQFGDRVTCILAVQEREETYDEGRARTREVIEKAIKLW